VTLERYIELCAAAPAITKEELKELRRSFVPRLSPIAVAVRWALSRLGKRI